MSISCRRSDIVGYLDMRKSQWFPGFFYSDGKYPRLCVRAGIEAQNCNLLLRFNRSTNLLVCTSARLTQNPCCVQFYFSGMSIIILWFSILYFVLKNPQTIITLGRLLAIIISISFSLIVNSKL